MDIQPYLHGGGFPLPESLTLVSSGGPYEGCVGEYGENKSPATDGHALCGGRRVGAVGRAEEENLQGACESNVEAAV